jgi:GNAT superfamily N-acetyltransferase
MRIDLTDLWRFQPDPAGTGEMRGYAVPSYDHRFWREVCVPVDFESCHPALDTYEGAGWFRRWVPIPAAWRGQRVVLRFEGMNAHARIWVNGREIGGCDDPFLPFSLEVQDALDYGAPNLIAVRVDNERRLGEVPGRQRGWRNYGGLLREVAIEAAPRCYLEGLRTVAEPGEDGGHLTLSATVVNDQEHGVQACLRVIVRDSEGQALCRLESPPQLVSVGEHLFLSVSGLVPGIRPWSPDDPALFSVELALQVRDETVETRALRVGFRTIEVRDGQLRLNGAPIFLTGFNRHEDSPERNMCTDLATARRDLEAMKAAGANFVRLCHYPHHPGELALCDELGLLVMDEIPLYWWNGLEEGEVASAAKLDAANRQLEALIARDRNHPSVIFWSVSNETHEERPEVAVGNAALVEFARSLDPTRLAVHVSDHWREHPSFEGDDVICVNAYPSVGPLALGAEGEEAYDLASSTAFWREELAVLHARYPGKPILVAEFGYTSFYGVSDNAFGGDLHAEVLEAEFAGMDARYVCGATIWCWADHAWPPATFSFCGYLAISPYGVLTRNRRRKPAYHRARALFRARQGVVAPAPQAVEPAPPPSGWGVTMIRPNMADIPQVPFPDGFSARPMRPDDGGLWADIWRDADEYGPIEPELFLNQFGDDPAALQWRGFMIENERGLAVATITAWYNRRHQGGDYGQIHWVAVRRAYWGRGLGKAMMTHALNAMAQWHERAYLGTQTKRLAAIKVYLDFGFVPDLRYPGAQEAWREVRAQLAHPTLAALDLDSDTEEGL